MFPPKGDGLRQLAESQAIQMHNLHVCDALRDEQFHAISLCDHLSTEDAIYYARYGLGRRASLMWNAYRSVIYTVHPERDQPLDINQAKSVSRDLNIIYINLVGFLDNLAWCLRSERGSTAVKALPQSRVGLFNKRFSNHSCFEGLLPALEPLSAWFIELRQRRDPAAHRIPLSIPPAALSPKEQKHYSEIEAEIAKKFREGSYEEIDGLREQQSKIGKLLPVFIHHPREAYNPFYPTISQDVANMIKIAGTVRKFIIEVPAK
jgi:hypothetical protein